MLLALNIRQFILQLITKANTWDGCTAYMFVYVFRTSLSNPNQ
jgi:hypothetical protein